jgi:hypothetical protein
MGLMLITKTTFPMGPAVYCGVLILIATSIAHGQNRRRFQPPKILIDVLDKDDRECVLTNGGLSKAVSVQSIRLAADGTSQLLIRGSGLCLCGAQNCGFWIYRKKSRAYELLLAGAGATKVRAASHHVGRRYRDVVSESHASAIETIVRTYRYDGQRYQLARCESRAYYDDNGKPTRVPITRACTSE